MQDYPVRTIGEALLAHRSALGLTQRQAAAQMGEPDNANYQRWETGKAEPKGHNLDQIFQWLGVGKEEAALLVLYTRLAFSKVDLEVAESWRQPQGPRRLARSRQHEREAGQPSRGRG